MARFKPTLANLLSEVRQRLLMNKSGSIDPGTADDTAITRRLNFKMQLWASTLAKLGRHTGLPQREDDFSLIEGETSAILNEDVLSIWQGYKVEANNSLIPITFISPKDEYRFRSRLFGLDLGPDQIQDLRAYILGESPPVIHFVTSGNDSSLVGDYKIKYYAWPDELILSTDETPFPATVDEILVLDTAASLAQDGGAHQLSHSLSKNMDDAWAKVLKVFVPMERVANRRVKDAMGYGSRTRSYFWR